LKAKKTMHETSKTEAAGPAALVTGAAGRIGPAICRELQSRGWRVAAAGRTKQSFEAHPHFPAAVLLEGDLRKVADCRHLVAAAEEALGPLSLLVNNATGNNVSPASLAEASPDFCLKVLQVDLLAAVYLAQAALPSLRANKGGIINISSVSVRHFLKGNFIYSAAKAALETLTESLAFELQDDGVRVNAVRVGAVPNPAFVRSAVAGLEPELARRIEVDVMEEYLVELGRRGVHYGSPDDVAGAVAFLASPAARFINGSVIPTDGGFFASMAKRAAERLAELGPAADSTIYELWSRQPREALAAWMEKNPC
jgi:NAD(P)-dependent dehydrogenase (short-subunit alcohol dehydrogenase family)